MNTLLPILRSESIARVLTHLYARDPSGQLSLRDLEERLGIPHATLIRVVNLLEGAGLLVSERLGRNRIVRANPDSPYHPELSALVIKAFGPKPLLERELSAVSGIALAFIFGSWAQRYAGEAGEQPQDIDLLVIGAPDVASLRRAARRASRLLGRDVRPVVLSEREWSEAASGFIRTIKSRPLVPLALLGE